MRDKATKFLLAFLVKLRTFAFILSIKFLSIFLGTIYELNNERSDSCSHFASQIQIKVIIYTIFSAFRVLDAVKSACSSGTL